MLEVSESNESPVFKFERVFTVADEDPLDTVQWGFRDSKITNEKHETIFEQKNIEAPEDWSDLAVNVVASRYFRGTLNSPEREASIKTLLLRVVETIVLWGREQNYFFDDKNEKTFRDELLYLLLHQFASFNSPVWFNLGTDPNPQCSACFILDVEDTMESILQWYAQEGMIFKGGSGSGINISKLRSSKESLSGGGTASGPISFMRAADASAGVIKSGGKTRRAAKMVIMNIDHPDITDFIHCKAKEEKKAHALIRAGYDSSLNGEAYASVAFQNTNHSVRVTDSFMQAVMNDENWETKYVVSGKTAHTYKAKDLYHQIAQAAHDCGDPGIQFDTPINAMHTCPESGPIRGSNPCSEYMHLDNSACNLASLKLTKFLNHNGFNTDLFRHAVDLMITAQDIIVDKASYPTASIRANSVKLRALGLGYADLGALLMSLALPYNSDEGRAWAGIITSIMTAEAYCQSARLASKRGAFEEFTKNREPMLKVLRNHKRNLNKFDMALIPDDITSTARMLWTEAVKLGEKFGYANCQVTVLPPTGTIAFMMDCDTTGVEPEIALVKYKKLSGGGRLKIINRCVKKALERLEYPPVVIQHILDQLEISGTIENIKEIAIEHLPVFDCAFKPLNGERSISPKGHVRMMAAIQPFISGAISKTVNIPSESTVQQIEEIYKLAWKLGLKSITVYRDGCKAVQPIGLSEDDAAKPMPTRRRLPGDCTSYRHKFEIAGQKGYLHTGFYKDGKIGEIFIRMAKEGSTVSGLMDTIATLTSIALQYGVPLEALVNKFSHMRFEPSGFTNNPKIPMAKSLIDYIFRYLGLKFLSKEEQETAGLVPTQDMSGDMLANAILPKSLSPDNGHSFNAQSDAPSCSDCGAIMVRNGSCYKCMNCGATSGCS
jgi:ribonucleoside-diphosphate reductase alpha chain